MKKIASLTLAVVLMFANAAIAPTADAIDLEPGGCYQYTRTHANACGGQFTITYETCMDEFGVLHTSIVSFYGWCV